MATKQSDEQFLEAVVKALVDHPDEVKVERQVDEMGVLLSLKLNPEDMGKIIGRQGNTVKAIRTLLRVIGLKNRARVNLRIEEPEGGRSPSRERKGVDEVVDELKL
jgi:uncharacterized protein